MAINDVLQAHSDAIDSIVSEFTERLQQIINSSKAILLDELRAKLSISGSLVDSTVANQKLIGNLDDRFMEIMNSEGYQNLLDSYTESFNGQFEWFTQILSTINSDLQYPLPFTQFPKSTMVEFEAYQLGTKDLLQSVVEKAAGRAKTQAVLSAGGMSVKELTQHLSDTLATSMSESENIAETSISSFYRTITDKGYQSIEDDLPGFEIRYNYEGPLDKLTRPFCTKLERLSRNGKTWNRAEINKMNNGQLPNVFVTGGGFRCRHQWVISVSNLNKQQSSKGKPKSIEKRAPKRSDVENEIAARRAIHVKRFKAQTGVDHPHEQLQAIRKGVADMIRERRAGR